MVNAAARRARSAASPSSSRARLADDDVVVHGSPARRGDVCLQAARTKRWDSVAAELHRLRDHRFGRWVHDA